MDLALQKVVQEEKLEDVTLEDLVDSLSEHEPRSAKRNVVNYMKRNQKSQTVIAGWTSSVRSSLIPSQVCGLLLQTLSQ